MDFHEGTTFNSYLIVDDIFLLNNIDATCKSHRNKNMKNNHLHIELQNKLDLLLKKIIYVLFAAPVLHCIYSA
jgi:flavorubredoxin